MQPGSQGGTPGGVGVAVLVLLEVRMQPDTYEIDGYEVLELQSLFCWKFVCNWYPDIPEPWDRDVAVLVLLEVRMQLLKSLSEV